MRASDYYDLLAAHDWTYQFSDSSGVYARGEASLSKLRSEYQKSDRLRALYDAYFAYAESGGTVPRPARPEPETVFRVIDFETTGEHTEEKPAGVIEVGFYDVVVQGDAYTVCNGYSAVVNCPLPVEMEARAVHHIGDDEIGRGILFTDAAKEMMKGPPDFFVAHNAVFEKEFFGGGAVPWLCTLKCAYRVWPDAPSYSNSFLRYYTGIDAIPGFDPAMAIPSHRAGPDAYTTAYVLVAMLQEVARTGRTVSDLKKISRARAMPTRIGFGKHKGKKWDELPSDYLTWVAEKSDMDADTKWLANKYFEQKLAAAAAKLEQGAAA